MKSYRERHESPERETDVLLLTGRALLLLGSVAAVLGFTSWGIESGDYETTVHWATGIFAALGAFAPALFAWGVLRGISEIKRALIESK